MDSGLENAGGMVILPLHTGSVSSEAAKFAPPYSCIWGNDGWGRGDYEIRERREKASQDSVKGQKLQEINHLKQRANS
jgi:hypothetical protein